MSNTLLFRFAGEELIYLLRALQIAKLPGLERMSPDSLYPDHLALALAIADRTLRARRVVSYQNHEERSVDPIVSGMLRDAAQPAYTLLADIFFGDKSHRRYLYTFSDHAAIEQWEPEPGIHEFLIIGDLPEVVAHLHVVFLGEGKSASPSPGIESGKLSVSRALMERIAAMTDFDEAARLLAVELPDNIADPLARAFLIPERLVHLALWPAIPDERERRQPSAMLTIARGDAHFFIVSGDSANDTQLTVTPATTARAWRAVGHLLRDALRVLPEPVA